MKKLLSFLLLFALLIGVTGGLPVFADGSASVYSQDYTINKNSSVRVYVQAKDFSSVSSLDLYIYYPDGFSVTSYSMEEILSDATVSCNTSVAGEISLSIISLDGISGSGTLFSFELLPDSNVVGAGDYDCAVVPGDAYDSGFSPVSVAGDTFRITVNEHVQVKRAEFYAYSPSGVFRAGENVVCDMYVRNSNGVASGDFEVSYDPDLLTLDSVSLSQAFTSANGAIVSVNDTVLGYAKLSFAALSGVDIYYDSVLSAQFTVKADVDGATVVTVSASGLYDAALAPIIATDVPIDLAVGLEKTPVIIEDPKIYIANLTTPVQSFSVSVFAEAGTGLAAGDFVVEYDSSKLKCKAISAAVEGSYVIGNPDFAADKAKFSFICQGGISADTEIACLSFDIISRIVEDTSVIISLSASGLVDADYQPVQAECVDGIINIDFVKALTGIELTTLPIKTRYFEGDELLSVDGGKVTLYYNDDTTQIIDLTADMVSGFDGARTGIQTLTVAYSGFNDTFDVEVVAKKLVSISVEALPDRLLFIKGEAFDKNGLIIKAHFDNDTSAIIEDYELSGYDTSVGKKTITVAYKGETATFEIEVVIRGDLNKNGVISVSDALIALRIAARLKDATEESMFIGDVDNDAEITVADALMILRAAVGLIEL